VQTTERIRNVNEARKSRPRHQVRALRFTPVGHPIIRIRESENQRDSFVIRATKSAESVIVIMLKGVPSLAGRNLRLLTTQGQVLVHHQHRAKASAAEPAELLDQETDLSKRAKFGHTGKQLQQKICKEVSSATGL